MKQTSRLVLLTAAFGLTQAIFAQTNKESSASQDEITKRRLEYKMSHAKRVMEQPAEVTVQDNKYNHREKEILEKLNTETIPTDFPVFKPEYSNEQYTQLMDKWYAANPSLLRTKNGSTK